MISPVDSTASDFTPRSTPTTLPGRVRAGSVRVISTENEQNQRPDRYVRVADRIRGRPGPTARARFRVNSCVRTVPIRGNRTCRRSSARPNAPVVNRHDMPSRLPLNLGNRTFGPRRVAFFDAFPLPSAVPQLTRAHGEAHLAV